VPVSGISAKGKKGEGERNPSANSSLRSGHHAGEKGKGKKKRGKKRRGRRLELYRGTRRRTLPSCFGHEGRGEERKGGKEGKRIARG